MSKGDTKARILDAAIRLFNESGTAVVSTNHIASVAEISPGNLYYHYRNKEEIIREILKRMTVEWGEVWVLPEERKLSLEYLQVVTEKNAALQWKYRFFYREILALMRQDPELARRYRAIQKERLEEQELFFGRLVEAGIIREPEDPGALPAMVKAGWILSTNWLSFLETRGEPVNEEKMREGFDILFQLLRPYLSEETLREPGMPGAGAQTR